MESSLLDAVRLERHNSGLNARLNRSDENLLTNERVWNDDEGKPKNWSESQISQKQNFALEPEKELNQQDGE